MRPSLTYTSLAHLLNVFFFPSRYNLERPSRRGLLQFLTISPMSARDYRIVPAILRGGPRHRRCSPGARPCHPSKIKYRMAETLKGLEDALDALRIKRAA